ncbi:hypothetical protein BW723_13215 [Polaribacter reichenbachii]|uniref:Carboxypeptidase-like regulatory domain-containing protein n=1 Tax=Polaribacter reichenbachii TaxID=996801 RepID=A0A1B8TZZ4_9FLAO|nr:carboxypeptidase-like regulatory domain-containing protein [Polaribacter reichenbachii]APZ47184.1 hypothetical protein BW723_13215 [Polaribacter reichenbachii]AUC17824.1 hypothetical protein BTO17_03660 [Polaribacter reichenbachii]OBY65152.1 hypothetical protein LPB301_08565 [Polaribacter reichenbachii]
MIKKLLFITLLISVTFNFNAQVIKGKISNQISSKPIFGAAILTNLNTGTQTNKLGEYEIDIKNIKTITFSCLGYISKTISVSDLKKKKFKVFLIENINQLDEIQLNLSTINLDSLLIKTENSMQKNSISGPIKSQFYTREFSEINFKNLELELEKSTLLNKKSRKLAEKELTDYATKLKESYPKVITEYVGVLKSQKKYSEKWKRDFNYTKIDTVQGITLLNNNKNITIETAQKDLQNIVLKHLDTNKTYKISSGLFKIEDSLSLKEIIKETDSLATDNSYIVNNASYYYNDAIRNSVFFKIDNKNNFLSKKYYKHILGKNEFLGDKLYYTVNFEPRKSKSKFSGKIVIDPKDYTIAKVSYSYAEGKKGQSLNLKWLLGIKASEDLNKVDIYYEKNKNNKVYTAYYKETLGNYAYVHRPIKFKENSKQKEKVKFDLKIEVNVLTTKEVLISSSYVIEEFTVKPKKKNEPLKRATYISLDDYEKSDWKNRQLVNLYLKKWK